MQRNAPLFLALLFIIAAFFKKRRDFVVRDEKTVLDGSETKIIRFPDITIKAPPKIGSGFIETTGLMCDCDGAPYTAPIIVNQVAFPLPPIPRFIYRPPNAVPNAAPELVQLSYIPFDLTNDFMFWHWGYVRAYRGSDGRIFLREGKSPSLDVIGADEYTMKNGKIYYGPNVYTRAQTGGAFGTT